MDIDRVAEIITAACDDVAALLPARHFDGLDLLAEVAVHRLTYPESTVADAVEARYQMTLEELLSD